MATINIKTNFKDVQKSLDKLNERLQQKVVPAALNKIVAKAKAEMTRAVTSEYNLTASEVRSRLRVFNARRAFKDWVVVLDPFASGRRKGFTLNMIRFVEKRVSLAEGRRRAKDGSKNQLRFKIKKNGKTTTLRDAFIATNKKTGGTAVFTREGKSRYPIQAKQTIDVPQMFNTRRIQARVRAKINKELPVEFDRAIKAALSGSFK